MSAKCLDHATAGTTTTFAFGTVYTTTGTPLGSVQPVPTAPTVSVSLALQSVVTTSSGSTVNTLRTLTGTSNPATDCALTWALPTTNPPAAAILRYRLGNGSWAATTLSTNASGNALLFDATLLKLPVGSYQYELYYYGAGVPLPSFSRANITDFVGGAYAAATGAFTLGSGTLSVSPSSDSATLALSNPAPASSQTVDRWGNVLSSTDFYGNVTTYTYNNSNEVLSTAQPLSSFTDATDNSYTITPTTYVYYDAYGRKIATEDAEQSRSVGVNANGGTGGLGLMNTFDYDAGGHLLREGFTDGGVTTDTYDQFGRTLTQRQMVDGIHDPLTQSQYDRAGRLIAQTVNETQYTAYVYDTLGNRLQTQVWGDYLGANGAAGDNGATETITLQDYDAFGRALDSLSNEYVGGVLYNGKITDTSDGISFFYNGNGQTQSRTYDIWGNVVATRDNAGDLVTDTYDAFGHLLTSTDLAGVVTTDTYDGLGHVLTQSSSARALTNAADNSVLVTQTLGYHYDAAGRLISSSDSSTSNDVTYNSNGTVKTPDTYQANHAESYTLDAFGRQMFKSVTDNGTTLTTTTTYDTLGRIATITDAMGEGVSYLYDANSNVRVVYSWYFDPGYHGPGTQMKQDDRWFTYDSQNRVLISEGRLEPATTGTTATPAYIAIDTSHTEETWNPIIGFGSCSGPVSNPITTDATGTQLSYDLAGRRSSSVTFVGSTKQYQRFTYNQGTDQIATVSTSSSATATSYALSETRSYDGYGRLLTDATYNSSNALTQTSNYTYDGAGHVVEVLTTNGSGQITDTSLNRYDALGNTIQTVSQTNYTSDDQTVVSYMNYALFGSEMLTTTSQTVNDNANDTSNTSDTLRYNTSGQVIYEINNGSSNANSRGFIVDMNGQVEQKNSPTGGRQTYLVEDGTIRASFGGLDPIDVDENDAAANVSTMAAAPGTVVTQNGDTLKSLALQVLGDSSLWYVLADANGLNGANFSADSPLAAGTVLIVPNALAEVSNNSNTVVPYNPASVIGSTAPSVHFPQPQPQCRALTSIIGVAIAFVVAIFSGGTAAAAAGDAGKQYSQMMFDNQYDWQAGLRGALTSGSGFGQHNTQLRSLDALSGGDTHHLYNYEETAVATAAAYVASGASSSVTNSETNAALDNSYGDSFVSDALSHGATQAEINAFAATQAGQFSYTLGAVATQSGLSSATLGSIAAGASVAGAAAGFVTSAAGNALLNHPTNFSMAALVGSMVGAYASSELSGAMNQGVTPATAQSWSAVARTALASMAGDALGYETTRALRDYSGNWDWSSELLNNFNSAYHSQASLDRQQISLDPQAQDSSSASALNTDTVNYSGPTSTDEAMQMYGAQLNMQEGANANDTITPTESLIGNVIIPTPEQLVANSGQPTLQTIAAHLSADGKPDRDAIQHGIANLRQQAVYVSAYGQLLNESDDAYNAEIASYLQARDAFTNDPLDPSKSDSFFGTAFNQILPNSVVLKMQWATPDQLQSPDMRALIVAGLATTSQYTSDLADRADNQYLGGAHDLSAQAKALPSAAVDWLFGRASAIGQKDYVASLDMLRNSGLISRASQERYLAGSDMTTSLLMGMANWGVPGVSQAVGAALTVRSAGATATIIGQLAAMAAKGVGIENPVVKKLLQLGLKTTFIGALAGEDMLMKVFSKIRPLARFIEDAAPLLQKGSGYYGEAITGAFLKATGLFDTVAAFQNNSGQGVDLLVKPTTGRYARQGTWLALEVKTSGEGMAGGLSALQEAGPNEYVLARLENALTNKPRWVMGRSASSGLSGLANIVLAEQKGRPFEGYLIQNNYVYIRRQVNVQISNWNNY